ncbi:hypothetical protein THAOC_26812 [Thalassiosira oceanica]|uniref:Uncharacterized protein n=1 Tax=Thalassiosira oceanica TaxID=159749 RepID=K0RKJ9_THAOC|nr:hypothetical protein THAOC_26812 [Thalassiosira oceanica]|eukprot:EJK53695.1 hypothetical protein THAOC_26812 [Thalassiosira oceanica]
MVRRSSTQLPVVSVSSTRPVSRALASYRSQTVSFLVLLPKPLVRGGSTLMRRASSTAVVRQKCQQLERSWGESTSSLFTQQRSTQQQVGETARGHWGPRLCPRLASPPTNKNEAQVCSALPKPRPLDGKYPTQCLHLVEGLTGLSSQPPRFRVSGQVPPTVRAET